MKQIKYIHKINLFFSFILVLTLFFSTASACLEAFDDDTSGINPSANWYTYSENVADPGSVSTDTFVSPPNCFKHHTTGNFKNAEFTLINPDTPEYINFSINTSGNFIPQIYLLKGSNAFAGSIFDFSNNYMKTSLGVNVSEYIDDSWFNVSFYINWTTDEYRLSGNNGSGWDLAWEGFTSSADYITGVRFSNTLAGTYYIDDLFLSIDIFPECNNDEPLNASSCNSNNTDFSVQIWDNDTANPINSTIYLYEWNGIEWSYLDEYNNDSITTGYWHNGTFNDLCMNRTYAWYVNLTSDGYTLFYPLSGYNWTDDDGNSSDTDYIWLFYTGCDNMSMYIMGYNETSEDYDDINYTDTLNVQLHMYAPDATYMAFSDDGAIFSNDYDYNALWNYTLPCNGNGIYTVWVRYTDDCGYYYCYDTINVTGITPDLTLTYPVEDETYTSVEWGEDHDLILEGVTDSSFNIAINVTCEWYTMLDDAIYTVDTDTILVSLEPYVCFDDTNYSIIINVSNCFGYQLLYVNFTIGDPSSDLARHISLKSLSPERENYSQLTLLEQGIYYDIISTEISGIPYTFLLTDWDGYLLYEINDVAYLDEQYGWQSKNWYKERFYSRSFYKSWIGIINVTDDVQFDDLYGYAKINYVSFNNVDEYHYIFNNTDINASGRYQILSGEYISDNALIYSSYTGIMWGFGTFHINDIIPLHSIGNTLYDNPNIYVNDWGGFLDEYYPGLSLFAGMMIILLFSLMPILITQSFPPMAIQMFFTSMGIVLSTCMGIFPLWVLQILSIAIIMAIFYKIMDWYKSRSGVQSFKDTPLGKDVGVKSAYGKMEKRGEGLKSIYGKYKEGRRSLGKDTSTSQPIYPGRRGE